jgi:hypothetical protein
VWAEFPARKTPIQFDIFADYSINGIIRKIPIFRAFPHSPPSDISASKPG